jgi:acetyltransferase EpsM
MEKTKTMVFYGASGHAAVVIEAWISSGGIVTAILDDNEGIKTLLDFAVEGKFYPAKYTGYYILSIGSNEIRKKLAGTVKGPFGKVVHSFSNLSASSTLEEGTVVMAGVVVNAHAKIGKHVILNTSCSIDHDCRVGDYAHVSPGATLCGGVTVGEGTHIGAGATVIQNITIGKWVIIGAGSVVVDNIPDYALVMGVPGRVIRYIR